MAEVTKLIQSVEQSRTMLLNSVMGLSEVQAAFRPEDGQWSVVDILEHLYLAEVSGVTKIWGAVEGLRAGRVWAEALPNRGKRIEDVVATTWKPKEVAPPIATPHIGGPLEFWVSATESLSGILADLGAQLEGTNLEEVVFPHYLSGPLDGRQRLEFLRFHIERHVDQIGRVRRSAGFPA
jgi:hypothetical protein